MGRAHGGGVWSGGMGLPGPDGRYWRRNATFNPVRDSEFHNQTSAFRCIRADRHVAAFGLCLR